MSISVLAVPLLSSMQQHIGSRDSYMPLSNQEAEQEAEQERAIKHQDVMSRGTKLFQRVGTRKVSEIDATVRLHRQNKPVDLKLKPEDFPDRDAAQHHEEFKIAAKKLDRLHPSVQRMHGELRGHVATMDRDGDTEKLAEATQLRNAFGNAEAWAMHHGEDRPEDANYGTKVPVGLNPKKGKLDAALKFREFVQAEMKKNPLVKPPALPAKNFAREKKVGPWKGESSQQQH